MVENQGKSETAKREEEILAFWRENKTFERSLEKKAPKGEFVFYDGPPFANGLPHHGHFLGSTIKDAIGRYKTMRGYHVRRRWGWDTHGLPVESYVEKQLGLKTKKDIETIGIAKFNETARASVLKFVDEWEKYVTRIGRWVDFNNSYKTMDNTYIESVWWALKTLWDKGLLYEGKKVLMYCTHCETPLAKAEIAMDNTYKDVTEEAITVKFKVKNPEKHGFPENTYLLAWTTTPWTLPGNVALAVGIDIGYTIESGLIRAAKEGDEVRMRGEELVGIEYTPPFAVPALASEKSYKVQTADFVSTEEGTGIVHIAPMYGEDDFQLGQREGLPMVQLLNPNGTYTNDVPEFLRGVYLRDANKEIKRDLESRGLLFARENHTHSYPHCYRCGTPLIYNAVSSWFINIQKVKGKMLTENEKVNWVPEHLKHGRFGNIVKDAPDWTISRNRFWASPLPIWKEKGGNRVMVIGSLTELKKRVKKSGNRYFIMRHGESELYAKRIISADINVKNSLTEEGKREVRTSAERLRACPPTLVYASPFMRTKETALLVAETLSLPKTKIIYDDRLKEFNFGDFSGGDLGAFLAWRDSHGYADKVPGGESYEEAKLRFGEFLEEIEAKHKNETILIVTHGIGLESLHTIADGLNAESSKEYIAKMNFKTGSCHELLYTPFPRNTRFELDLHRPYTDSLILLDDEGREYERIPEVVDCWVESGCMPFAEYHYPFENAREFEKRAPGDFIAEYIAQTRTWFYYMHALGILLFDRLAFRNVVTTGTIVAADGSKMSKSKGNYTDPLQLIEQYGADALRLYLMSSPVMQAEDLRFRDEDVRDAHNRVIGILWNSFKFFDLYQKEIDHTAEGRKSTHVLDRWVFARLDALIKEVTDAFDIYDTPRACRAIKVFVDEYSTWYVRRSRERVKGEWHDKQFALETQKEVLLTLAKLIAPIMPFLAEVIWRGIEGGGSVHLESWAEVPRLSLWQRLFGTRDTILEDMREVRAFVTKALEARDKAGLKVRQPLQKLTIGSTVLSKELRDIIRDEVNVKEVALSTTLEKGEVLLDTVISDELREEGLVRDIIRAIQAARKEHNLHPGDIRSATISLRSIEEMTVGEKATLHIRETTSLSSIMWKHDSSQTDIRVHFNAHVPEIYN